MKVSRKKFLQQAVATLAAGTIGVRVDKLLGRPKPIEVGICTTRDKSALARQAGCSFIEEGVGKMLMPDKPAEAFETQWQDISKKDILPLRSFIYFLPAGMQAVGADATHEAIITYASTAFKRAKHIGASMIVFGSGRARNIPDGFNREQAMQQMVSLCSALAPLAEKQKVVLAVEPLNKAETNFLNTSGECATVVEKVAHPHFKMVFDVYHALRENDPAEEILRYRQHIVHCQIAEKEERTAPGVKGDDFTPYFRAFKKAKYRGALSFECKWKDMEKELPVAVKTIQEQYANA